MTTDELDKTDKNDEDNKEEEEDMDKEEEFFFAKILKMTKCTSLPNLVRLSQWEQVSEYILTYYIQPVILKRGRTQFAYATLSLNFWFDWNLKSN